MNKITKPQLAAMLLITDGFWLFCLRGDITPLTCAGLLMGTVLQLAVVLPLAELYSSGTGLRDCGRGAMLLTAMCLTVWGGVLLALLKQTSGAVNIPGEDSFSGEVLIAALIALVGLYASSAGLQAVSRAAVIAGALGVLCLGVAALSAGLTRDWSTLAGIPQTLSLPEELVRGFTAGAGSGALTVLLGFAEGSSRRAAVTYFAGRCVLIAAVTVTAMLAAGRIMPVTEFPAVTAAQLIQPFSSQRVDSLFLIVFSVSAVFSVGVQAVCVVWLMGEVFPELRYRGCIAMGAMAAVGLLLRGTDVYSPAFTVLTAVTLLSAPAAKLIRNTELGIRN